MEYKPFEWKRYNCKLISLFRIEHLSATCAHLDRILSVMVTNFKFIPVIFFIYEIF